MSCEVNQTQNHIGSKAYLGCNLFCQAYAVLYVKYEQLVYHSRVEPFEKEILHYKPGELLIA